MGNTLRRTMWMSRRLLRIHWPNVGVGMLIWLRVMVFMETEPETTQVRG